MASSEKAFEMLKSKILHKVYSLRSLMGDDIHNEYVKEIEKCVNVEQLLELNDIELFVGYLRWIKNPEESTDVHTNIDYNSLLLVQNMPIDISNDGEYFEEIDESLYSDEDLEELAKDSESGVGSEEATDSNDTDIPISNFDDDIWEEIEDTDDYELEEEERNDLSTTVQDLEMPSIDDEIWEEVEDTEEDEESNIDALNNLELQDSDYEDDIWDYGDSEDDTQDIPDVQENTEDGDDNIGYGMESLLEELDKEIDDLIDDYDIDSDDQDGESEPDEEGDSGEPYNLDDLSLDDSSSDFGIDLDDPDLDDLDENGDDNYSLEDINPSDDNDPYDIPDYSEIEDDSIFEDENDDDSGGFDLSSITFEDVMEAPPIQKVIAPVSLGNQPAFSGTTTDRLFRDSSVDNTFNILDKLRKQVDRRKK